MEGEYTGHVKDGKVHGVGVCVYTDGSRYQGDWKAGLKCGRGTHSFASGDQFEGEWEDGWMHALSQCLGKIERERERRETERQRESARVLRV